MQKRSQMEKKIISLDEIQDLCNKDWAYFANGIYAEWEKCIQKIAQSEEGLEYFIKKSFSIQWASCVFSPLNIWLVVDNIGNKLWMIKKGLPNKTWNILTSNLTEARKNRTNCSVYVRDKFIILPAS